MPRNADRQRFRNEDLILKVSKAVDRYKWDEDKYEAFLDELCGDREYQKEAIRTTLRYLLGGEYTNLRDLAKANYDTNDVLEERYGSWQGMERHLQLPEQLSCSLDLATGVGKSYVLFGLAAILLAEGTVDRVLVLCPSTTIEDGLLDKFRQLASDADLRDLLPTEAKFSPPRILNASESITEGSVCVENYHAILEHVGSSIRDSLKGKGARVAVLNDETHHVANELAKSEAKIKRWKEFLLDPDYGFGYVVGVSGTCYVGDDYFADVVYRYSLRQAMEENYVKKVDYVAEMPQTGDPDEKWQLIYNRHEETRKKLKARKLRPLSIIVTPTIKRCEAVAEELKAYMVEEIGLKPDSVDEKVLIVYNNAPDVSKLPFVDRSVSKVEWIVSVSMLNEGWDVKRVFQIVPHEERAFNSKLLIAQVLGRGLRIPDDWKGAQPEVTVFNHDAWAPRIRHLVNEILEIEKRLSSHVMDTSPFHFELHNIDYTLEPVSVKKPMTGEYTLFRKDYVDLATDAPAEDVSIEFERAATGDHYKWQTKLRHKTFSAREVAEEMYRRLEDAQDPDDADPKMRTVYTDKFPIPRLEKIVKESLAKIGAKEATDSMKQKFLQSLGTLRRKESENVRYKTKVESYLTRSTKQRQSDSVNAAELRNTKTVFYTEQTRETLLDEQVEFFDEATEAGSGYKTISIQNRLDFKTPLNAVIADSDNERRFINMLLQSQNVSCYNCWIKSTATRFYDIDYAWKKGEHPKRGKFNPDVFINMGNVIVVIEIKGDEELHEPSEENKKKNEYALAHFERVNENLKKEGSPIRYKFTFLTERSFNIFFQSLREGKIKNFKSELDVKLAEES
ncbi:MAG: DEAD/DEAH box helicase family protein [Thermodesulfobacteriota bacterium]